MDKKMCEATLQVTRSFFSLEEMSGYDQEKHRCQFKGVTVGFEGSGYSSARLNSLKTLLNIFVDLISSTHDGALCWVVFVILLQYTELLKISLKFQNNRRQSCYDSEKAKFRNLMFCFTKVCLVRSIQSIPVS